MSKVRSIIRLYTEGVSKSSISVRTGLPCNTVKKNIRLFLASGRSMQELEVITDARLEQMFLTMTPRVRKEDDPGYKELEAMFPEMEIFILL